MRLSNVTYIYLQCQGLVRHRRFENAATGRVDDDELAILKKWYSPC